jgi:hypothetical protein
LQSRLQRRLSIQTHWAGCLRLQSSPCLVFPSSRTWYRYRYIHQALQGLGCPPLTLTTTTPDDVRLPVRLIVPSVRTLTCSQATNNYLHSKALLTAFHHDASAWSRLVRETTYGAGGSCSSTPRNQHLRQQTLIDCNECLVYASSKCHIVSVLESRRKTLIAEGALLLVLRCDSRPPTEGSGCCGNGCRSSTVVCDSQGSSFPGTLLATFPLPLQSRRATRDRVRGEHGQRRAWCNEGKVRAQDHMHMNAMATARRGMMTAVFLFAGAAGGASVAASSSSPSASK